MRVTLPDGRLLIPLLGVRMLGLVLLLIEGLGVLVLVGVLMDRDEVIVLEELDLALEGCRVLVAEEGLETCRLWELLPLDLLLLLDLSAPNAGPIISIRAKTAVIKAFLTFFWDFSVAIILLLSTNNVITVH